LKGIILHGGHGTRLRPLTHTGPKQLLPIANKPMSQYALEDLKKIGITDIGIIIGDVYPEKVKEYYGDGSDFGVKISYIYQEAPKGIAHAIKLCREFIGNEKFVVYLGDNVLRKDLTSYSAKFLSDDLDAMILLCEVPNPSQFGIAELNKQDPKKIIKIVEKPKEPSTNLAVIGIYFLTPKIFEKIDLLKPSWRGEYEITDALQLLIDHGHKVDFDTVTGWWKDTGTPEDILHANKLVLDSIGTENQFLINSDAQIKNQIVIGKNSIISHHSKIIGPTIIGENCIIGDGANLGPYVSIGNDCNIQNSRITHSIIMSNCTVDTEFNLTNSIIATGSKIEKVNELDKEFLLGERTHLKL